MRTIEHIPGLCASDISVTAINYLTLVSDNLVSQSVLLDGQDRWHVRRCKHKGVMSLAHIFIIEESIAVVN